VSGARTRGKTSTAKIADFDVGNTNLKGSKAKILN